MLAGQCYTKQLAPGVGDPGQGGQVLSQHTHAGSVEFTIDSISNYKVAAFVRNPWDRLYSCLNSTDHACYQGQYSIEAKEFVADRCAADVGYWHCQFADPHSHAATDHER